MEFAVSFNSDTKLTLSFSIYPRQIFKLILIRAINVSFQRFSRQNRHACYTFIYFVGIDYYLSPVRSTELPSRIGVAKGMPSTSLQDLKAATAPMLPQKRRQYDPG
ncbi:Hypothetical_protein [Hexamita inflata]|uniref:Hypothetical_protein n=1 Tax=Hexamita inflata TaxID=28002 RepID=A0AA86TNJ7_9EUKA|nr:Hypothetical protein HINF_LOCUS8837 [Hexamita inflata]